MSKNNKELLDSISYYIYSGQQDSYFLERIHLIDISSFLNMNKNSYKETGKYLFIDTKFLLSKMILPRGLVDYFRLIKLIRAQLCQFPDSIFDFLPIRFFGEEFHKNNYFFQNFNNQRKLLSYYEAQRGPSGNRKVSIQVLISRFDFLEDVLLSIFRQRHKADEIFLFANFKNRHDIPQFEELIKKYFRLDDTNVTLVYAIKPVSESEARIYMPTHSRAQYILPLDDDDFLDVECVSELKKILSINEPLSLIRGLYRKIDIHDHFGELKSKSDNTLEDKIKNELTRRGGKYLFPMNLASVDQLYVYNKDILNYYDVIIPKNKINNTGIEIELFLKSEEIGGIYLIEKELYYRRVWRGQVTSNLSFQKELFRYMYRLIQKVITYRNIKKFAKIDLFPYLGITSK